MKKSKASFSHMGSSIITSSVANTVGYLGVSVFGGASAAAVGGMGSMIAFSALGAAALYFPTMMLRNALEELELMNSLISDVITFSYCVGSAALGAVILGLAIEPAIMCALVGVVVCVCLGLFISPEVEGNVSQNNNRNHMFNLQDRENVGAVNSDGAYTVNTGRSRYTVNEV